METDPKDIKIEQLRQELETVEQALKKQREINRQFERDNAQLKAKLEAWQRFGARGVAGSIENLTEVIQQRNALMPPEMRTGHPNHNQRMVGITLILKQGVKLETHTTCNENYPGTFEDALNEIMPSMTALIRRIPRLEEFSGKKYKEYGITDSIMIFLFDRLAKSYHTDPQRYEQERLSELKSLWDSIKDNNPDLGKEEFLDLMGKTVKRSLEYAQKNRGKVGAVEEILEFADRICLRQKSLNILHCVQS